MGFYGDYLQRRGIHTLQDLDGLKWIDLHPVYWGGTVGYHIEVQCQARDQKDVERWLNLPREERKDKGFYARYVPTLQKYRIERKRSDASNL